MKTPQSALQSTDIRVKNILAKSGSGLSPVALSKAYADWFLHLAASPARQWELGCQALALSVRTATQVLMPKAADKAESDTSDHRFEGSDWRQWPFNAYKEGFKSAEQWWDQAVQVPGVSAHHTHMVRFYARQMLDALSPNNYPLTNPEVLRSGYSSLGRSRIKGYQNYLHDTAQHLGAGLPKGLKPMVPLPYAVGKDVAVTPGKVVFRNHLIELIQYEPATSKVAAEPLLIVPSCIMKYYILDLSPANSMVRFLVEKGYTVFMVSWRNPDADDRDLGLDDYLQQGVMQAMSAVSRLTGAKRIHGMGYCLGGTFLSIVAAALGRRDSTDPAYKRMPVLASISLLAAMTDFTEPGEMGILIDEDQVKAIKAQMEATGFLSGKQMAGTFQFLNSRDLIWSRNTKRYLMGQDEVGNDMMSWNADVTRLPARMHSQYLEQLFLHNELATGKFRLAGKSLTLMDIKAPMLVVGTVRDHVCPWQSVYKVHLLTDTDTTFILASGGHNAGIVSEPGHPKRSYQTRRVNRGHGWTEPRQWQASSPRHEGSWWEPLYEWLQTHSGKQVAAREISNASSLPDAPGEYVMVRYAD
jgi:polyhydroxyalkanoate synthase